MSAPRHKHHLLLPEIGGQGQKALAASTVLIVGAGGLGCPILSYLAGAGVGTLIVADGDVIELSNLPRQTLYTEDDIGKQKAIIAARRLRQMNSEITIKAVAEMVTADNAGPLISQVDLVVEGVDSLAARHALNRACLAAGKPFLSAAASRFSGQVALFRPGEGEHPCYACLVPEDAEDAGLCSRDGVAGPVVGMVGALAANEVIKHLCGLPSALHQEILVADLLRGHLRKAELTRDPGCPVCGSSR